jgi:hypothetical protein
LLRALHCTLQQEAFYQQTFALNQHKAQTLQARCDLVERVEHWQRQTRQRVVNAVRGWSTTRQCLVWSLTLGVPEALLAQSAAHVEA